MRLTVRAHDWVVVCDGRKALVLENMGDQRALDLRVRNTFEHADPPTHALGGDRPGRLQPSVGTARSAVEQVDWHDAAERTFLENLAERLHAAVSDGSVKAIIMVAPPRALGMLRKTYSRALSAVVVREIGKDWVKKPVGEIERDLMSEVADS